MVSVRLRTRCFPSQVHKRCLGCSEQIDVKCTNGWTDLYASSLMTVQCHYTGWPDDLFQHVCCNCEEAEGRVRPLDSPCHGCAPDFASVYVVTVLYVLLIIHVQICSTLYLFLLNSSPFSQRHRVIACQMLTRNGYAVMPPAQLHINYLFTLLHTN